MAAENLVVPRFFIHTVLNEGKSRDAGRPIYDEMEVCELRFAGNKQTVGVFPAHEVFRHAKSPDGAMEPLTYALAYREQYLKFKANEAQDLSGTPLAELPFLTASKRLELKALNVHTAEALAALDGTPLKQLGMQGRELKNQAQAYLDAAHGNADVTKMAAENAGLKDQISVMQEQIAELVRAGKGKTAEQPAPTVEDDAPVSPFTDFEDEDIRNWITATFPDEKIDGRLGREKLLAKADELNKKLKDQKLHA